MTGPPTSDRQHGNTIDCSLVICTRNRATSLERCLAAVRRIRSALRWELVVVDNGSTDDTERVVEEHRARADHPVRYRREPEPGLARARNVGCRSARGEILVLTDDDCYPEPDFVDAVAATFDRHSVGYIGARILLYDLDDAALTVR